MGPIDFNKQQIENIGSKNDIGDQVRKFYKANGKIYVLSKIDIKKLEKNGFKGSFKLANLADVVKAFNQALLENKDTNPETINNLRANAVIIKGKIESYNMKKTNDAKSTFSRIFSSRSKNLELIEFSILNEINEKDVQDINKLNIIGKLEAFLGVKVDFKNATAIEDALNIKYLVLRNLFNVTRTKLDDEFSEISRSSPLNNLDTNIQNQIRGKVLSPSERKSKKLHQIKKHIGPILIIDSKSYAGNKTEKHPDKQSQDEQQIIEVVIKEQKFAGLEKTKVDISDLKKLDQMILLPERKLKTSTKSNLSRAEVSSPSIIPVDSRSSTPTAPVADISPEIPKSEETPKFARKELTDEEKANDNKTLRRLGGLPE